MLSTRSRFRVLSEMAEEEKAASSFSESGEGEKQQDAKRERRRQKITIELFETEKTYLHHMELVNKHFDFPLRFNCLISEKDHGKLFCNLEQIMGVNKTLLECMEQTTVGEAFQYLAPFLKLYSTYANNHHTALDILQENIQKNADFVKFIHEQEEKPELMGLKLNALLITPVQRIPRYRLLLEDLVANTNQEHHDYLHLKEAAQSISQIAEHINDHMKQNDNFHKMLSIQKSFDGSAPKILAPGREFIKEGMLRKVSRRGGKPLERMFFLFNDMLIYGKAKLLDGGKSSYSCCCVLPLKHCQVERVLGGLKKNDTDTGGMFKISCKDENLLLYTGDQASATSWITDLETNIKKLCSNRSTLRKPSSTKAPLRGKSLFKHRQKQNKKQQKQKAKLNPVKEISPLKMLSEFDVSNCRTPNKRRKIDKDQISTPVSCTRNGKPLRPKSWDLSDVECQDNDSIMDSMGDVFENTCDLDTVDNQPMNQTENTFMQMTMDDLGDPAAGDLDMNSFCQPAQKPKENTQPADSEIFYTQSSNTESTSKDNRFVRGGKKMSKRCRQAFNNAQNRISETKQYCSIQ